MENLIIHSIALLTKIYFFGNIYLFWINWFQPAIQNHYYWAKRADAILNKIYNIGTREIKISKHPTIWKRVYAHLQIYYCTLKSLLPALLADALTRLISSAFLNRNFPGMMRRISNWKGVRLEWKIVNSVFGEDKSIGKEDYSKWKRTHSN